MEEFKNLLMDFYELTMGQVYVDEKKEDEIAYFDLFFRNVPDNGGFVIANGINRCIEYLLQFKFTKEDIEYLKGLGQFSDEYIDKLSKLKFTGDCWAVQDGTVVFPNEPIITIRATILQAQLVETALLLYFNRSSLITTKASRIVRAAMGRSVMEFGTRRAQGVDASIEGALDAYEAGAIGTACTVAGKKYGIPVLGTMAHSFIQKYDSELEAFKAYATSFPNNCVLLVDTYDTLKNGIPDAIQAYKDVLQPEGKILQGIRIDSGDLAYLSKEARRMLDEAGLKDTKIVVSNSLDEYTIESLLQQGAPIDSFGVGERLITSQSAPVLGGVYKLCAIEDKNGNVIPKIKISENKEKITNPHFKNIYRLYDKEKGKFITDMITVYDEPAPINKIQLKHPDEHWVTKSVEGYEVIELRKQYIKDGKLAVTLPTIQETRCKIQQELGTLWSEALRLDKPHQYIINLSDKLMKVKNDLLENKGQLPLQK